MANCTDCIHFDVCRDATIPNPEYKGPVADKSKECRPFKNKADFAEVKHGEWIKHKRNIPKMRDFHKKGMGLHMSEKSIFWACSCCNQWGNVHDKYCSVCGAKMDGGKG